MGQVPSEESKGGVDPRNSTRFNLTQENATEQSRHAAATAMQTEARTPEQEFDHACNRIRPMVHNWVMRRRLRLLVKQAVTVSPKTLKNIRTRRQVMLSFRAFHKLTWSLSTSTGAS